MFRLTQFLREIGQPSPAGPRIDPPGPVVVWNLTRRCNLTCKHCYTTSADVDFPGELSGDEIFKVMDDLKAAGVKFLILSGGEPLLRPDIFEISRRAKEMGFYSALSSNGALINEDNIKDIAAVGYDYVGVSIDGVRETHDKFRRLDGAYEAALKGIGLCRDAGLKTGLRFTMTNDNARELEQILDLLDSENINRFYFSHLNFAGRGNRNRKDGAYFKTTRCAMDMLFKRCLERLNDGNEKEFVTGNNDADGVYLLLWIIERFPEAAEHMRAKLAQWGGNASGVNVANIDNAGNVHPDTMWWHYTIGNVLERPFGDIWSDVSDPLMAGLKRRPRQIKGRCGACRYFDICGGNTRVRAQQITGDPWAEDPACYLTDQEIGAAGAGERVKITPYSKSKRRRKAS
ncbi:MAG TPA: heme d1 biosynthesis radical SAM protein NirJ [Rhodospirillales bacterium]|nr:heme d1 biosynthesis radical SAM protein NirJ [Rhodospirillales bacterium]